MSYPSFSLEAGETREAVHFTSLSSVARQSISIKTVKRSVCDGVKTGRKSMSLSNSGTFTVGKLQGFLTITAMS